MSPPSAGVESKQAGNLNEVCRKQVFIAGFLLGSLFQSEDEGDTFLGIVG
jgi:hypothetical protein